MAIHTDEIIETLARANPHGDFISVIVRKKGIERFDPGSRRVMTYDDDLVHALLWTGTSYLQILRQTRDYVLQINPENVSWIMEKAREEGLSDVTENRVRQELEAIQTASSHNLSEDAHIYPKAQWDYKNPGRWWLIASKDTPSTKAGTSYVRGVKLGETIIEPSSNGPWNSHSPRTIREIILSKTLSKHFRMYRLDPDRLVMLKVGRDAIESAKRCSLSLNLDIIRQIFPIPAP